MSTKHISDEELSNLKDDGWKIHMIGVKNNDDHEYHLAKAKSFVLETGGRLVEDIAAIDGFSAIFPPESAEVFNIYAIDHISFSNEDKDINTSDNPDEKLDTKP
ncbi:hypothetical protein HI914_03789 [Erysiphe necator]|uniref:Uncharacterized protein n=1 Tax=Uncinula necator TaxID=52586 RepID=A0A0B1NYW1_UNCNE|nr:hypothetical protein HI914_03789 [Erysiphe necator]KHJ31592.1 hypothetical protein EV44_g4744 [Erysiphe necator]